MVKANSAAAKRHASATAASSASCILRRLASGHAANEPILNHAHTAVSDTARCLLRLATCRVNANTNDAAVSRSPRLARGPCQFEVALACRQRHMV